VAQIGDGEAEIRRDEEEVEGDDAQDRRANRLYLLPAARPLLAKLAELRGDITEVALGHLGTAGADDLVAQLQTIKDNVRDALQDVADHKKAQNYG